MSDVEMTVTATIASVHPKKVNRKSDGKEITLWEVELEDGSVWTTGNIAIGNQARDLIGYPADMTVKVVQNGDFQNKYLQKVKQSASQTAVSEAIQTAQQKQQETSQPAITFEQYAKLERERREAQEAAERHKNTSIYRQVAAKVAAALASPEDSPDTFWTNVVELMVFFESGLTPFNHRLDNPEAGPDPLDPDAPPPHSDDDIPF